MNSNVKTAVLWIVLICVAVLLWIVVRTGKTGTEQQLTFSDFLNQVEAGTRERGHHQRPRGPGASTQDGARLRTIAPPNYPDIYKLLKDKKRQRTTSRRRTPATGSRS